ncbi:hydrolase [Saccharopolyspora rhizosphaerae]|uniref:lysozyme n=1 Tax=Saccharopolyspora rhizosphaerae TaxID=2492662 RepID=A0A426K534_9PSEU|nr:lysozyme [Saccharopolyspora rhizosphaerae]RRO20504.1 hydrolase [Saccharopolyspora rhizosphaerae]
MFNLPGRVRRRAAAARRSGTVVALAVVAALASAASPAHAAAPRLDPHDPHGAWMGYSAERTGQRSGVPLPKGSVAGMDVSGHQPRVDWARAHADGARFAYVKATEGTGFRSSSFDGQYRGSAGAGMVRGAYHFALPDRSPGAEQAHFFVDNGGGWAPGSGTLPGVLDIEHNPYGETCYGLDPAGMSRWIADFSGTYHARTGRPPVIYTTTSWWNRCTGGNPDFAPNNPLWIARYAPQIGALPAGWGFHSFWQHNDNGPFPGGQDVFNGNMDQLHRFAG